MRLSGIYGPGRNAFVNLHNGSAKRIVKPGQVFNRAHVDDIAAETAATLVGQLTGKVSEAEAREAVAAVAKG